jgi:hypothetical protein
VEYSRPADNLNRAIGSQPGSSLKLGLAIQAMAAVDVNWLILFGKADMINRMNRI